MSKSEGPSRVNRRNGSKTVIRRKCQGTTTSGLRRRAMRQLHGKHRKPVLLPAEPPIGLVESETKNPVVDGKVVCGFCDKLVRAKKNGDPYKHECAA